MIFKSLSTVILTLLLSTVDSNGSNLDSEQCLDSVHRSIVIIRHGKPKLLKEGWYSFEQARNYSFQYDTVSVEPIPPSFKELDFFSTDTIYCSSLQRAKNTAQQLFLDQNKVIVDSMLFREFEREVPAIPILQMPLNFWLVLSRVSWMLGLQSDHIEGFQNANLRVKHSADLIEKKLTNNKQFVLVAHGLFNAKLVKELKRRGFKISQEGGRDYLATWILTK